MTKKSNLHATEPPPSGGALTLIHPSPTPHSPGSGTQAQRGRRPLLQSINALFEEVAELEYGKPGLISDGVAHWLTAQYAFAAKEEAETSGGGPMALKILGTISAPVSALRGGDHSAAWVKVWNDRLKFDREKHVLNTTELFIKWSDNKKVKETLESDVSYADKIELIATELFGEGWRG